MNLYTWVVPINGGAQRVSVEAVANSVTEAQELIMGEIGKPNYREEVKKHIYSKSPNVYDKPKAFVFSEAVPTAL